MDSAFLCNKTGELVIHLGEPPQRGQRRDGHTNGSKEDHIGTTKD